MSPTITALIVALRSLPGVTGARYWQTPDGSKRRMYVSTVKLNGGKAWNGGVGYQSCYLDLVSGEIMAGECAGAATRDFHAEHGTFDAIRRVYLSTIHSAEAICGD